MGKIVVMIIDGQPFFRAGMRQTLSQQDSLEILECDLGEEAIREIAGSSPDVVLLDIGYPSLSGLELGRKITRNFPGTKVVMLSANPNVEELFEVVKTGAVAYMSKRSTGTELVETIRRASCDEYPINESIPSTPKDAGWVFRRFKGMASNFWPKSTTMPSKGTSAAERSQRWAGFTKVSDFLLVIEPIWVLAGAALVYLPAIFGLASFLSWVGLAIAFSPFPLRQIRHGYLSQRTPFDIPIAISLGGIIVGMSVSEHFAISLGAFQTFLVLAAFYYSFVNYGEPSRLIKVVLLLAAAWSVIASVFAASWVFSSIHVPKGLGIQLIITAAIAFGIAIFGGRITYRVVSGLFGLMLLVAAIFLFHQELHQFFTLQSIESRLPLWQQVLKPIEGSLLWTGLGLGCWPLTLDLITYGHVHNAYLELYVNTGIFGMVALICFVAIGVKLAIDIVFLPRKSLYYGFGIGVLLAIIATALVGFVESSPFGLGFLSTGGESYHYVLSPIPWVLAWALVTARRLLSLPPGTLLIRGSQGFNEWSLRAWQK